MTTPSTESTDTPTEAAETFAIPLEVAEAYEAKFVPSIFAEWAPHILDAADVGAGMRILDVACGTGIVARTALDRVGPAGSVTGLDLNEAMLTVAARVEPGIEWRQGDVGSLPFEDDSFDAVVCQMAMMFFPDRRRALAEMGRVTTAGGSVAIVVPAAISSQPAYRPFVDIAVDHAGESARTLLDTYWSCGDLDMLTEVAAAAGLEVTDRRTRTGTAGFDSSDDFVATEVEGSPLRARIDDDTYAAIKRDTAEALARFATEDGRFEVPLVGHVLTARPAI